MHVDKLGKEQKMRNRCGTEINVLDINAVSQAV